MKVAKSLVLEDVVEAEELAHGDCKEFHVVCLCCGEAVFKGERTLSDGRVTHYLSHYERASESADCEHRVAAWTAEDIAKLRREARGQSLAAYMARFRERVRAHVVAALGPGADASRRLERLRVSPSAQRFVAATARSVGKRLRDVADQDFAVEARFGKRPTLVEARLPVYLRDLSKHLATEQQKENLEFLCRAFLFVAVEEHRRDRAGYAAAHGGAAFSFAYLAAAFDAENDTRFKKGVRRATREAFGVDRLDGPRLDAAMSGFADDTMAAVFRTYCEFGLRTVVGNLSSGEVQRELARVQRGAGSPAAPSAA